MADWQRGFFARFPLGPLMMILEGSTNEPVSHLDVDIPSVGANTEWVQRTPP